MVRRSAQTKSITLILVQTPDFLFRLPNSLVQHRHSSLVELIPRSWQPLVVAMFAVLSSCPNCSQLDLPYMIHRAYGVHPAYLIVHISPGEWRHPIVPCALAYQGGHRRSLLDFSMPLFVRLDRGLSFTSHNSLTCQYLNLFLTVPYCPVFPPPSLTSGMPRYTT